MQNANACKSLFSSAILTPFPDQPIYSLFCRDCCHANDDLRFQRKRFRNLVEKTDAKAKAFFLLKQNRTR
jgi:hypothetical protein